MKTYYQASLYSLSIHEVKVIEETKEMVTIDYHGKPRSERKLTISTSVFPTRKEAKQWLIDRISEKVKNAKDNLVKYESQLKEVNKL